jgi:hypothetical protein
VRLVLEHDADKVECLQLQAKIAGTKLSQVKQTRTAGVQWGPIAPQQASVRVQQSAGVVGLQARLGAAKSGLI